MQTSIATVSISGTLDAKLEAIAAAGFDGVEIFDNDLISYSGSASEIGALMRKLGLRCTLFQPFRDFEGMPVETRGRLFDRLERKFDVMGDLGTDLLLICSNVSPAASGDRARIVDDFRELGERAKARGLRIGYEALAWGRHVFDHRDAWAIVREADHPNIGLILDSFHSLARGIPTDSLRDIDPDKIFLVQLADAPLLTMDLISWSRHFRCMPGQGELAVTNYVATLAEIGYRDVLSLEIFNDRFRAGSAPAVARDGKRSLVYLDDQVRRRRSPPEAELPARVSCRGVEFIEFAAAEEEAEHLAALFAGMGFTFTGQHRTKAVTRWTQGAINLVINCEIEGFARSHEMVHGVSVCAIGLRVQTVEAALRRAEGLGMQRFTQPSRHGGIDMPAIRAIGGTLIYFVEEGEQARLWEAEFEPRGAERERDLAGALVTVDHIAQSMHYEEMLSWVLYYVALFDMTKTPQLDIADPLGLVQSQAIETPGRGFRVTLNCSAGNQTAAARFLHAYVGPGVQHIAFSTCDIFAAARRARQAGFQPLAIPHNYYEDLKARFGLAPEMLAELADLDILYDRDAEGEYFQFYSATFADRFFFEVVQRRSYDAYGAANASIRLAAQARDRLPSVA